MSPHEKAHIINALGFELDHCDDPIVYDRMVERLCDIDLDLAKAVAEKAGSPTPTKQGRPNHGKTAKGLSQTDFTPEALGMAPTIASRSKQLLELPLFIFRCFGSLSNVLGVLRHLYTPPLQILSQISSY